MTVRQTHDNLVSSLSAYLVRHPVEEIAEYRRALAGRQTPLLVLTPVPLTSEQQKALQDTLSSLADHRIELQVQQDPSLIAGLRLRLGDQSL